MLYKVFSYWKNNRERFMRLAREGGWVVAGQVATVLGMLVLVRVLTEYLDPAEYGKLALGLTIAGLVNQVVMGGVVNGVGRFYSVAFEKGDIRGYLHATQRLLFIATLVVIGIAVILIGGLIVTELHQWLWLAIAALIFSIVLGYNSALKGIQNAARQRAIVALHGAIDAWLKIGLAVGIILWLGTSIEAVVFAYALSALFVTLSQLYFLRRLILQQVVLPHSFVSESNENWMQQIWTYSWPFCAFGVFTWVQQISDRWALEGFATTSDVGQYAVLFQLGYTPINILTGLMMSLIGPILYQRSGSARDASRNASVHGITWQITQACLVLTALSFVVTWIFHGLFFQWLVAEAFRDVSFLLPWVVLAGGLFATGQMLSLKLMSELRSKSLLVLKIATAVLGVCANVLGAWLFGVEGVVGGLIVFSVVSLGWVALLAKRLPAVDV